MCWSKEWINNIDTQKMSLYPIQFANVDRIEKNPAVFIFDETGSGKTISTGLMALHYLYNHPNEKCLIFTIPSLVDSGQFINDWFTLLPFRELGLVDRIVISNDVYSNIEKCTEIQEKWGLVILDEAHRYLEAEARKAAIRKLRAQKVIFMTASPIKKEARGDFENYCALADEIIDSQKVDRLWIDTMVASKKEENICSIFDEALPVTRYFKDTIMALEHDGDFEKKKAIRKTPIIWQCDNGQKRVQTLLDNIRHLQCRDKDGMTNRFIIFTRYIWREAKFIENCMCNDDNRDYFVNFDNASEGESKLTYLIINSKSEHSVGEFSDNGTNSVLPDILIINYQIAEAGVNLPGYNYVINYHIPAYPAALEQRFGRVDRMGKTQYRHIYMVYLLSKTSVDTYEKNFAEAVRITRKELLSNIPAKNTILTKEVLEAYHDIDNMIKPQDRYSNIEKACCDNNKLEEAFKILRGEIEYQAKEKNDNLTETEADYENELLDFCNDHEISVGKADSLVDSLESFKSLIDNTLESLRDSKRDFDIDNDETLRIINNISDKIYYFDQKGSIKTIPAIKASDEDLNDNPEEKGCAELILGEGYSKYKEYCALFNNEVSKAKENTELWHKYSDRLEDYFEEQFIINDEGAFDNIFVADYGKLVREKLFKSELDDAKQSFADYCSINRNKIMTLPFFRMVETLGNYIYQECGKNSPNLYGALQELIATGIIPDKIKKTVYAKTTYGDLLKTHYADSAFSNKMYACSNWLKLAFISIQEKNNPGIIEKICLIRENDGKDVFIQGKPFCNRDIFHYIIITDSYSNAMDKSTYSAKKYWRSHYRNENYAGRTKYIWNDFLPTVFDDNGIGTYTETDKNLNAWYYKYDFWSVCIFRMLLADAKTFGIPFGDDLWIQMIRRYEELQRMRT